MRFSLEAGLMEACGARDRVTDSTGEWQVVGRPYITNGGKNAHVRVRRVDNAEVAMIRSYSAHERVSVRRATTEEGRR
jgi:hypothetical protein